MRPSARVALRSLRLARLILPLVLVAVPEIGASARPSTPAVSFSDYGWPDWSSTGSIAFKTGLEGEGGTTVMKPTVAGSRILPGTEFDTTPAWSPDGSRLVVQIRRGGSYQLATFQADGSGRRIIVGEDREPFWPDWSPDGRRILFVSQGTLFVANADGSGQSTVDIPGSTFLDQPNWPDWSPDGNSIIFSGGLVTGGSIKRLSLATGAITTLTDGMDDHPAWSPDGKRIAFTRYVGTDDGEIFVMNADGSAVRRLTSNQANEGYPTWSPDAKQIAFHRDTAAGRDIWVMNVDGSGQRRLTGGAVPKAGNGRPCTIHGTPGPDILLGTPSSDVVCGLGANDRILAGGGGDIVDGGRGSDQLLGQGGNDAMLARDGTRDVVDGGPGRDRAKLDRVDVARGIEIRR